MCKTTNYPHLIQLADGRIVKLRVEQYYGTGQDDCNTTNSLVQIVDRLFFGGDFFLDRTSFASAFAEQPDVGGFFSFSSSDVLAYHDSLLFVSTIVLTVPIKRFWTMTMKMGSLIL